MKSDELFAEARLLFHALEQWQETLHHDVDIAGPMRGVLEMLLLEGRSSVPAIARSKAVSRQSIQQQVDALLRQGLVVRRSNPAHKRSPLIELADKGRALIQNIRAEELRAFSRLQTGVSDEAITEAAHVLAACRAALVTSDT